MKTIRLGKHTVEIYGGIEELPAARHHKWQRNLLVDAGVGGDIQSFDRRTERLRRYMAQGKAKEAAAELENLRQAVYLIQTETSPRHRAFACLVARLDGKSYPDASDEAVDEILATLGDVPEGEFEAAASNVKKKIDSELALYFPALFGDADEKEYYDLLKRRTLALLKGIAEGADGLPDTVDALTGELITWHPPRKFGGSDGAEVQSDLQYEDMCLLISEQLHADPRAMGTLSFYNAYQFLQERARQADKARQGRRK